MQKKKFRFSNSSVDYFFGASFSTLREVVDRKRAVLITDENVLQHHEKKFKGWNTIVIKAGEAFKIQSTVDSIIDQLIGLEADRQSCIVGVGGGVVTDITGYVASVYMRGVRFGFVPSTLLSLVDASIGGKNGIDVGVYKNMVGTIRQPSFILHDLQLLKSLPEQEWKNGFAEIIKHACIKDAAMFRNLEAGSLSIYRKKNELLSELVRRNTLLKTRVVTQDEFEIGDRRLLNFGHTLGHALENQYELSHGEAVSVGMAYAAFVSESVTGFKHRNRVTDLLERFNLPVRAEYDKDNVIKVLKMDKKRTRDSIRFILLERLGKGIIKEIPINELYHRL